MGHTIFESSGMSDKDVLEFVQISKNNMDAASGDENEMNNAAPVPMSSEMRNIMKRIPRLDNRSSILGRSGQTCMGRSGKVQIYIDEMTWQLEKTDRLDQSRRNEEQRGSDEERTMDNVFGIYLNLINRLVFVKCLLGRSK
ncbi:hypothetical protein TNCV_4643511 [Trichonephila clavipes]|nr:hypothetical protein TNCV_4643511 [Trichonephila clavipes]